MLHALSEAKVNFLVVGAFAVAVHSEPRATGDLDIWVEPTSENAKRVFRALTSFGAPLADLTVDDLSKPGVVFQMGLPPNRIDILTQVSGISFQEAWATHSTFDLRNLTVPVIGCKALIKNKKAAGRPKDLLDVELLEKHFKR